MLSPRLIRFINPGNLPVYILFFLMTTGSSCRKVIHPRFEADPSPPAVIEATLSDRKDSAAVLISGTLAIYAPNVYAGKDGAAVSITPEGSLPVLLNGFKNGRYGGHITTRTGQYYTLTVQMDGATYTATSPMPAKVIFDSLFITRRTVLGRELRIPTVTFSDPRGTENYYRFILSVDGFESTNIFIETDRLFNGNKMTLELLDLFTDSSSPTFVDQYDQVIVEMQCINKQTYDYLYQLKESALGQGNTVNPGNPQSNLTGGALGYFSVHTSETKKTFAE
ncbi:DUF4249 family protein [Niabella aurantiaca]|uniref:DUF4249 family protein n=1 Tax=Niabella aurantiaca TaxID=379900 RepID=UPI0003A89A62|nr:DUF4249 family protein [Niabella aurantiaca]